MLLRVLRFMRPIRHYFLLFLPVVTTGCSTCSEKTNEPNAVASVSLPEVIAPGDAVVGEVAHASFIEGSVSAVHRQTLILTDHETGKTREVDSANVYRLGKPAKTEWQIGDLAICRIEPSRWRGCKITSFHANQISIVDDQGHDHTVDHRQLLVPSPVTKLNLVHAFDRVERRRHFEMERQNAGDLYRPTDWKPRAGENVILRNGSHFVGATVSEARNTLLLVQSGGQKPHAVAVEDVWPEPPVETTLSPKSFACLRPPTGEYVWQVVRIEAEQNDKWLVSFASGEQNTVASKDLLPFVPARTR